MYSEPCHRRQGYWMISQERKSGNRRGNAAMSISQRKSQTVSPCRALGGWKGELEAFARRSSSPLYAQRGQSSHGERESVGGRRPHETEDLKAGLLRRCVRCRTRWEAQTPRREIKLTSCVFRTEPLVLASHPSCCARHPSRPPTRLCPHPLHAWLHVKTHKERRALQS